MKCSTIFIIWSFTLLWIIATPVMAQQATRIIIGSHVRIRHEPNLSAQEITQLQFGTVIQEIGRTDQQQTIGQGRDYWYHVTLPDGQQGWVFGSLTRLFTNEKRDEIYWEITQTQLARIRRVDLSFPELIDFYRFLCSALEEVNNREIMAELQLARLLTLVCSVGVKWNHPNFDAWIKEQRNKISPGEPSAPWVVKPELFWNLHLEYKTLPIADDIAWEAAINPLAGECNGDVPCHVARINRTYGKYVALYPDGKYVSIALQRIAGYLQYFDSKSLNGDNQASRLRLQQEIDQLQATVEKTLVVEKESVLEQLHRLEMLYLKHE